MSIDSVIGTAYADLIKSALVSAGVDVDPIVLAIPKLTPRQIQVLSLVTHSYKDSAIATTLDMAPRTVGVHLNKIYWCFDQVQNIPSHVNPRLYVARQWWEFSNSDNSIKNMGPIHSGTWHLTKSGRKLHLNDGDGYSVCSHGSKLVKEDYNYCNDCLTIKDIVS